MLPRKLDTRVHEGGSSPSTGQRQLLCFSRALLRTSTLLLLWTMTRTEQFKISWACYRYHYYVCLVFLFILFICFRFVNVVSLAVIDWIPFWDRTELLLWILTRRVLYCTLTSFIYIHSCFFRRLLNLIIHPTCLLKNQSSIFHSLVQEAGLID